MIYTQMQKLKIIKNLDDNFSKQKPTFEEYFVTDLYKLKFAPTSFYTANLLNLPTPLSVNKTQLLKFTKDKLKKYKVWSLKNFIQSLRLLQLATKEKRLVRGNLLAGKKAGFDGMLCQLKNAHISLSQLPVRKNKKSRFSSLRYYPNLSKFEFFIPKSQFLKKFPSPTLNYLTYPQFKLQTKYTPENFTILKLKLLKFKHRRIKRLINVVSGF